MIAKADLEGVLVHYGGEPPTRYGWAPMKCILHDDSRASASVNLTEGKYNCHTCLTQAVDGLDIVQQKEGISLAAAIEFVKGIGASGDGVSLPARREDNLLSPRAARPGRGQRRWVPPRLRG